MPLPLFLPFSFFTIPIPLQIVVTRSLKNYLLELYYRKEKLLGHTRATTVSEALGSHRNLKKVLKAHKAIKPLQIQGLLSSALAHKITNTMVNVVA
ncbi:hypothetical protein Q7P35_000620 [Cladosporium inversicolor]